jgi:uncharacterized protein YjiK
MTFQKMIFMGALPLTAIAFSSFYSSCANDLGEPQKSEAGFDLNHPTSIQTLPSELYEISGLTDVSDSKIACVQDEKGIIYTYDIVSKKITGEIPFASDDDYEGLTRVDDALYTLVSDGTLYEIKSAWKKPQTKTYELNLPSPDNEGLCYDEKNNRLLIAPKSKIGKGPEFKDSRAIFVFDLHKKKLADEPLFYFSIEEIYAKAAEKGIESDPVYKKNGQTKTQHNFRPSSIAVHPKTGDIYVISADDFALVIFSETGTVKDYFVLDKELFAKPEGITFLPNGTMIITNEGVDGNATLLVFE